MEKNRINVELVKINMNIYENGFVHETNRHLKQIYVSIKFISVLRFNSNPSNVARFTIKSNSLQHFIDVSEKVTI